ncbi:DUF4362 domain-containing protein [Paenibacillus sinopodophylli]|uniref:DUF4362 domain-containing protein n=1 Tax=Paenibacillus sinopodophylli TaxID=1837342 RepID=UPI0014866592|nr:DUF4362 domain-containing protein [Paenibacillus sinopodophylli]
MIVVFMALLTIMGCGGQALDRPEQAAVNDAEDVIDKHGEMKNDELLDAFVIGDRDVVRVVRYTTEGDPLFYTLSRKQEGLEVRYDTSQDKFGSSTVKSYVCQSLQKTETNNGYAYQLNECGRAGKTITLIETRT